MWPAPLGIRCTSSFPSMKGFGGTALTTDSSGRYPTKLDPTGYPIDSPSSLVGSVSLWNAVLTLLTRCASQDDYKPEGYDGR